MARRLNELTGLAITSFQGANQGDSFIVDGNSAASSPAGAEPGLGSRAAPQDLLAASENAALHVLGMYLPGNEKRGGLVDVEVRPRPNRSHWC